MERKYLLIHFCRCISLTVAFLLLYDHVLFFVSLPRAKVGREANDAA